jgi:broad specificity phosphatase PhoE
VQQRGITFTHIFSSNLTRARLTADAILNAQTSEKEKSSQQGKPERINVDDLREQDFGSFECQPWASKPAVKGSNGKLIDPDHPDFKPKETHESMAIRMNKFVDESIHPLLATDSDAESTVAVVSHGIILSILWRALLERLGARGVSLQPEVRLLAGGRPLEYLPTWSNTGYLELHIKPALPGHGLDTPRSADPDLRKPMLSSYEMHIKIVNGKDHLNNLKRTRGGLGSTAFDTRQKNLEGFFKRPKIGARIEKPG